jgi:hypothetical protein
MMGRMAKTDKISWAVLTRTLILSRLLAHPIQRLTRIASVASLARFSACTGERAEKYRCDESGELARSVVRLAVSARAEIGRLQEKP